MDAEITRQIAEQVAFATANKGPNWEVILTVIVGAIAPTLTALAAYNKSKDAVEKTKEVKSEVIAVKAEVQEVKVNTDGKFNALTAALEGKNRAEGKAEGKIEERSDQAARETAAADKAALPTAAATPVNVNVVSGPLPGTEAIRTKTDPMEAAIAARAARDVEKK